MRILVVYNGTYPEAVDASAMLSAYLSSQGIDHLCADSFKMAGITIDGFDMAVALGGDGTMLRTARLVATSGVPILGMNYGHLGFLSNSVEGGVAKLMSEALAGDVVVDERTNLRIDVFCEGDDFATYERSFNDPADFNSERCYFALNEIAITRGTLGRIIEFDININGVDVVEEMRGDGIVVASSTGSTAYALSAGGPLMSPSFRGLVAVPLAAHTLVARAIVCASKDVVEIILGDSSACLEAQLQSDGIHIGFEPAVRRVRISRNNEPTKLLRTQEETFYERMSTVFFKRHS